MMTASIPLAWLGTYLIHSTLLLGAAWIASRLLRGRRSDGALALEESLWKGALVGALLTATLQVGLGLANPVAVASSTTLTPMSPSAPVLSSETGMARTEPAASAEPSSSTPYPLLATPAALLPGWQRLVLGLWLLGGLGGAAWLAASWVRLRRLLRRRAEIAAGPRHLLDRLLTDTGTRRPVRLTGSGRLPVPVALGVLEREICLPRRALDALGPRRQSGLLAHELAHLERRDPAWLLAARTIEKLLFVQPLNRLARARLQEIAELRCDAWAVERTGDRTALARCLTEVAGWLTGGHGDRSASGWPAPAWTQLPSMASGSRELGQRVERILDGSAQARGPKRRWSLLLPAALLIAVGCLAPGIAPLLPDAASAEAAEVTGTPATTNGDTDQPSAEQGDQEGEARQTGQSGETGQSGQAAEEPEQHATRTVRRVEDRRRTVDRRVERDRQVRRDARIAAEDRARQEVRQRLDEQVRDLETAHDEMDREIALSTANQKELLDQLRRQLVAEMASADREHELSSEARAQLQKEVQRLAEQARKLDERSRPSREQLTRMKAEALRLAQEAEKHPERVERYNDEVERLNREAERMSRDAQRMREDDLGRLEERAAELQRRVERAESSELERHAEALRDRGASLEDLRQELEQRMSALEERRQEAEERFAAERAEIEKRQEALEREAEARERAAAASEAEPQERKPPR